MAFTLTIKRKGLFNKKQVSLEQLLSSCNFRYGSDNEYFILEENEINNQTMVLYNPNRIGRGIFLDASQMERGTLTISYNIPTTASEIQDFIHFTEQIVSQYEKVEMYCVEEERNYTLEELVANKENMVAFSLQSLHDFCNNKEYMSHIFTLAMWPWVLTEEQVQKFESCEDLCEFEEIMHNMQCIDVYYAKPRLYLKNEKVAAFYVLTEECESIFPIKADNFINLDQIEIEEGCIQFYIFSEDRMLDGLYDYDKFMKIMLERGVETFDKDHVRIPSLTKQDIEEIVAKL